MSDDERRPGEFEARSWVAGHCAAARPAAGEKNPRQEALFAYLCYRPRLRSLLSSWLCFSSFLVLDSGVARRKRHAPHREIAPSSYLSFWSCTRERLQKKIRKAKRRGVWGACPPTLKLFSPPLPTTRQPSPHRDAKTRHRRTTNQPYNIRLTMPDATVVELNWKTLRGGGGSPTGSPFRELSSSSWSSLSCSPFYPLRNIRRGAGRRARRRIVTMSAVRLVGVRPPLLGRLQLGQCRSVAPTELKATRRPS